MATKKKTAKKPVRAKTVSSSMNNKVKKLNVCDISFVKLSSMAFILFLITLLPTAMNIVKSIHWGWWLGLTILLGLKPLIKAYS